MKKAGLILSMVLTAAILGAAAHEVPDARERARSAVGSVPAGKSRALVEAAHALQKAGDTKRAFADYTLAIDARALPREEQARALFDRGLLFDETHRLGDALGDYSAALALSPKFAAALNNRANVYRRLDRFDEARRDYLASLAAHNPQSQYPYYGLGQIAEVQGDQDTAHDFYKKALSVDPNFTLARRDLAALDRAPIHLHPPGESRRVAENVVPAEGTAQAILLRPPAVLHPRASAPVVPTAYRLPSPALKPSLDGHYGGQVQLGAWRSEAEAEAGWNRAVKRADGALEGFSPHIVTVDLPKGRYYRLRVVSTEQSPKALCAALVAKRLDCIPVRD